MSGRTKACEDAAVGVRIRELEAELARAFLCMCETLIGADGQLVRVQNSLCQVHGWSEGEGGAL